jgi:nicotinamide riboside kinase
MSDRRTLVVNLLGGPGSGKSTTAAQIFSELKWSDIECELAPEYAKDLVWEQRKKTFTNQIYLFGKQHHRIYRLLGQVDVVITDSPLLLTPIYDLERRETLKQLALQEYRRMDNLAIVLKRRKKYHSNGRNQDEQQAKEVDNQIRTLLKDNQIPYNEIDGTKESVQHIVKDIKSILDTWKNHA